VDWDHQGNLLGAARGCLWRDKINGSQLTGRQPVADLNEQTFAPVAPPEQALRW